MKFLTPARKKCEVDTQAIMAPFIQEEMAIDITKGRVTTIAPSFTLPRITDVLAVDPQTIQPVEFTQSPKIDRKILMETRTTAEMPARGKMGLCNTPFYLRNGTLTVGESSINVHKEQREIAVLEGSTPVGLQTLLEEQRQRRYIVAQTNGITGSARLKEIVTLHGEASYFSDEKDERLRIQSNIASLAVVRTDQENETQLLSRPAVNIEAVRKTQHKVAAAEGLLDSAAFQRAGPTGGRIKIRGGTYKAYYLEESINGTRTSMASAEQIKQGLLSAILFGNPGSTEF